MPRIKDITMPSKKFKKKQYRPWDILDVLTFENGNQISNNQLVTNKESISNQLDTNKEPEKESISNQLDIKKTGLATNKESISNHISNRNKISISNQLDIKTPKLEETLTSIKRLYGLQRKILFYVVNHCCMRGQLSSGEITNESLRLLAKTNANTIKTAVQRLISKGLLKREFGKRGVGGFCSFIINESVRNAVLEEKKRLIISNQLDTVLVTDISNQLDTNRESHKEPNTSSSSSNIYIKTTTTGEPEIEQNLANQEEWKKIDINPLVEIGFSKAHLLQIAKQNLIEPTVVQESIYAFSFDLKNNGKAKLLKKSPIDFFMGILRNGSVYAPPSNYKPPKEIALEAFIQKQNHIQELEEKAIKLGFENWVSKITPDEKNTIVPEETRKTGISALINQTLRTHFRENIWPTIRKEIMQVPLDS